MTDSYAPVAQPTSAYFTPGKHVGALVLFTPTHDGYETKPWQADPVAVVYASCFVLQGEGAGSEFASASINNLALAGQLRAAIGTKLLGRLATQGRSIVLKAPTEDDIAVAQRWESANPGKTERAMRAKEIHHTAPAPQAQQGGMPTPPPVTQPYTPPF